MKKLMKKVVAMAGALLFSVTVLAGIPGFTAKAEGMYTVDRTERIVYEGDVLEKTYIVCFVKPGMSEQAVEAALNGDMMDDEMRQYLLHENEDDDIVSFSSPSDYRVPAAENGSNGYIIPIQLIMNAGDEYEFRFYFLEPYTAENTGAPVPVYVEPAWLTDWKELLEDTDKQISEAKSGDTVVLELGEYYNISNARMQQIAEKRDVTYVLNITYENVNYRITIEPGTEIDCSFDWYGPLKLLSMFPYEIVE